MQDLSHLPYSSFLAALDDIAIQHPDVRKLADTAAAATLEENVAILAKPDPDFAITELIQRRPGSGSGSDPRSHPGTGYSTDHRSGEHTGRGGAIAVSPTRGRRSVSPEGGNPNKVDSNNREDDGTAVAVLSPSRRVRKGGTGIKAGANAGVAAAVRHSDVTAAAGLRPDDQRLLVLLQKYVLVKSQAGKEVGGHRYTSSVKRFFASS